MPKTARKGLTKAEKDKWVKALVSGRYEQAREKLHNGRNGYCCLGVLAKAVLGTPQDLVDGCGTLLGTGDGRLDIALPENSEAETVEDALIGLNDFVFDDKPASVPFDLIAGLVIDPWNGRD